MQSEGSVHTVANSAGSRAAEKAHARSVFTDRLAGKCCKLCQLCRVVLAGSIGLLLCPV